MREIKMNTKYQYIYNFKRAGFGLYCHFGLYSVAEAGEWYMNMSQTSPSEYEKMMPRFIVRQDWAKRLLSLAKRSGVRYITFTTRHHEGFSLYDTKGLSNYDVMHSPTKRDLVKEFADECHKKGILPIFYHTIIDWHDKRYLNGDFPAYFAYLRESIRLLCTNYGRVGGFFFDGSWGLPKGIEFPHDIYVMIHELQPEAVIINNTGLCALGAIGDPEIDAVTFERGHPFAIKTKGKPLAGEADTTINDHWGYAKNDINYKSMADILNYFIDCRAVGANFDLDTGPKSNGLVEPLPSEIFLSLGKWLRLNKNIILDADPSSVKATNAAMFEKGRYYYAVIKNVPMSLNPNVTVGSESLLVRVKDKRSIKEATWLDNGEKIELSDEHSFLSRPFYYGTSWSARVAKIVLK